MTTGLEVYEEWLRHRQLVSEHQVRSSQDG